MDSAQVGVFKEADQVSFGSLLKGHDGRGLEAQVCLEVLGDLTDETLEGQLADQELSGLLVTTDLTESNGTGPVTVRLLDSSCSRSRLASSLGGQLLAWGLASGGFTSGLLGTSHGDEQYSVCSPQILGRLFIPSPATDSDPGLSLAQDSTEDVRLEAAGKPHGTLSSEGQKEGPGALRLVPDGSKDPNR